VLSLNHPIAGIQYLSPTPGHGSLGIASCTQMEDKIIRQRLIFDVFKSGNDRLKRIQVQNTILSTSKTSLESLNKIIFQKFVYFAYFVD
jgi:hypothetical protein